MFWIATFLLAGSLQVGAILDNVSLPQNTEILGVPDPVAMILLCVCFIVWFKSSTVYHRKTKGS